MFPNHKDQPLSQFEARRAAAEKHLGGTSIYLPLSIQKPLSSESRRRLQISIINIFGWSISRRE
jgi:hypothetical protein